MPNIQSGWLLPTGQVIYLGEFSHSEVVIKFLSGLLCYKEVLGRYCLRDFKRYVELNGDLNLSDTIEDYAVFCLRWIKIGNAFNYNDNKTITVANYDSLESVMVHYENIGYQVNRLPIKIHYYEKIELREYKKIVVSDVIQAGNKDYDEYFGQSDF